MVKALVAALFVVVLSAAFTVLHRGVYQGRFEQLLTREATDAIHRDPALAGVSVRFKALDAILEGTVATPKERDNAQRVVDEIKGARVLASQNGIRVNPVLEFRGFPSNQFMVMGWLPPGDYKPKAVEVARSARPQSGWDWSPVQQDPAVGRPAFLDHPVFPLLLQAFASSVIQGRLLITPTDLALDGQVRTEAERLHVLGMANRVMQSFPNGVHSRLQVSQPELRDSSGGGRGRSGSQEVQSLGDLVRALQQFHVYFDSGSTSIKGGEVTKLTRLAAQLKKWAPQAHLQIVGRADSSGNPKINQQLSAKRAEATAQFLTRQGIPASQLHVQAAGELRTTAPSGSRPGPDTPESKREARRVEITLLTP